MASVDEKAPADVVDPLLWREARTMLGRHAGPDHHGCCQWCGHQWPCSPRRLAERAEAAARSLWLEAYTVRHDLNSVRAAAGTRAGAEDVAGGSHSPGPNGGHRRGRHAATNRGYFD